MAGLSDDEENAHEISDLRPRMILPRPMISTLDTWDSNTQIEYPGSEGHRGRRLGWNIPSVSVASESVATVRSNVNLRTMSPQQQVTTAGFLPNPFTASKVFKAVPNMKQVLRSDAQVQITFSVDIQLSTAGNEAQFAIYRDGQQISQIFSGTTSAAGISFNVSGAYTDIPSMKKIHVYELRWRVGSAGAPVMRIISPHRRRTFQVSNLRAQ